jgi:hypothetical protein
MPKQLSYKHLTPMVFLGALFAVMWLEVSWRILPVMVAAVTLVGYHFYNQFSRNWQRLFLGFVLMAALALSAALAVRMFVNLQSPPVWDFQSFWLNGRVADEGLNFYNPASYQQIVADENLMVDPEFQTEIVDVGFWYAPPTIWLFVPLGWFGLNTAMLFWYIQQVLILVVCIYLAWRLFFSQEQLLALGLIVVLLFALPTNRVNIGMGQSTLVVLLTLILFWRDRENARSGVWLAAAFLVKPFMAVLVLYPVIRRNWRFIGVMGLCLGVISLLTIVFFGLDNFTSFFIEGVESRVPPGVYTEVTNQSLLATVLRLTDYQIDYGFPLTHPLFLTLAVPLTLFTLWGSYSFMRRRPEWAIALMVTFAILIYPASQSIYSLLLVMPIFLLWQNRHEFPGGVWGMIFFIVIEYYFLTSATFIAAALMWGVLMLAAARILLPSVTRLEPNVYSAAA